MILFITLIRFDVTLPDADSNEAVSMTTVQYLVWVPGVFAFQ